MTLPYKEEACHLNAKANVFPGNQIQSKGFQTKFKCGTIFTYVNTQRL